LLSANGCSVVPRGRDGRRREVHRRALDRLAAGSATAADLYEAMLMLTLYPDRANTGSLWGGANKATKTGH